jgi:type I restriction enzyme S subunit
MERIKQGYKQTDIGVIPEDWEVKSIGESFRFLNNATFSRAELDSNGTTGYIHYGDIHTKYNEFIDFDLHKLPCISDSKALKYKLVQDGDIVMADASEDYVGLCKSVEIKNIKNNKVIAGLHTILMREKTSQYKNGFKGYLFLVPDVKRQFVGLATGMKVYGVSKSNLPQVLLPIPTLEEQTAIATALSDTDALIAVLDKKIAKKQQIKQGAMQQLLTGKKRLSGFSGEWVKKTIFEIGRVITGSTPSRANPDLWNGDFVWVSAQDFKSKYIVDSVEKITEAGKDTCRIVPPNTVLVTCIASIGLNALSKVECATNQQINSIVCNSEYEPEFLYYQINNNVENLKMIAGQTAVPIINKGQFENFILMFPNAKSEQTAIAQILTDMDNEIMQLEKERDKYKALKAGMMQMLLTGKVRLINVAVDNKPNVIVHESKPKIVNHNDKINEAVVISFLVDKFSSSTYPLSRFRYTKYAYLLHRQIEHVAKGFKKHAAGPYKSDNRYKGPENIAIKNKYIAKVENPKSGHDAFVQNENINQALNYFNDWYGVDIQEWIEQFRYYKNDDLEVLTTVDESMCDLNDRGTNISVMTIKQYIASIPQWKHKLTKDCFCDLNIQKMIEKSRALFSEY